MNNKGFMMAEVVVVSAIVLVTLVGLYSSYSKIFSLYNQRVDYYDIKAFSQLVAIREKVYKHNTLEGKVTGAKIYDVEYDDVVDYRILVYYAKDIDTNLANITSLSVTNQTFKDYLKYLSTSLDVSSLNINGTSVNEILILENCKDYDDDGTYNDDCKYAYLEVLS